MASTWANGGQKHDTKGETDRRIVLVKSQNNTTWSSFETNENRVLKPQTVLENKIHIDA